jgi:hypothetical protein
MNLRKAIILMLLVPLLAFMAPSAATAATRLSASGTFTQTSFTVTDSRTAGRLTFLSFEETDVLTGTLTGTTLIVGECIVFASGEGMCKASETFTGTVDGMSGTLEFLDLVEINTNTGEVAGRFIVVDGTGDLAGAHGQGTFSGAAGTGTYAGTLILTP